MSMSQSRTMCICEPVCLCLRIMQSHNFLMGIWKLNFITLIATLCSPSLMHTCWSKRTFYPSAQPLVESAVSVQLNQDREQLYSECIRCCSQRSLHSNYRHRHYTGVCSCVTARDVFSVEQRVGKIGHLYTEVLCGMTHHQQRWEQ